MLVDNSSITNLKIIDWGLARTLLPGFRAGRLSAALGTPSYVAPEILAGRSYDSKIDLWSIGVIAFELLCGYLPFSPFEGSMLELLETGTFQFDPEHWEHISPSAMDFIKHLIVVDPEKRLSATEALQHPWIRLGAPNRPRPLAVHGIVSRVRDRQRVRSSINFEESYTSTSKAHLAHVLPRPQSGRLFPRNTSMGSSGN